MYIALHLQCRGKEVRTFLYGDYDFLCNMYGLSGASGINLHTNKSYTCTFTHVYFTKGRHCCLWCHIQYDQLKDPPLVRGPVHLRTVDTIRNDHQRFLSDGGNLKRAKFFNNAINLPFFPSIPLEQVRNLKHTCKYKHHLLYPYYRCVPLGFI